MKVVCISDTHGLHDGVEVPEGDLLIHAGDITNVGKMELVRSFNDWLATLPHPHKIVIAGNHDFCFERTPEMAAALITHAHYLLDNAVDILGRWFAQGGGRRERVVLATKVYGGMAPDDRPDPNLQLNARFVRELAECSQGSREGRRNGLSLSLPPICHWIGLGCSWEAENGFRRY